MIDRAQVSQLLESDVVDSRGEKIGAVRQVWLDDQTGAPLWAEVHTGLFGMRDTFVPIQDASLGDGQVMVPLEKKQVKDSPSISVHDGHMSEEQQDELYRYYGMIPQASTGDHDRLPNGKSGRDGRQTGMAADQRADAGAVDRRADGRQAGMRDQAGMRGDGKTGMREQAAGQAGARGRAGEHDGAAMVRHEEELHAGVRDVEAGRVRLVKHVVTEEQQITVPVKREEVRVVREPVTGGTPDRDAFSEGQAEVTLHREEPVVEKTVRPVEKVRLDKETVTDERTVSGTVRKERVDIQDETGGTEKDRAKRSR
ncbi:DUF2382 domain-containing protein [Actinokineospora guangxiensis]|uniref:DUF2382 domain-containing protein n=1 Tax=Actinokineospora guangxiensis TaxID=1490288 RepID=A0ABW0ERN3_9PSEU